MVLDKTLPPRLRISNVDLVAKQWSYERMTKRELLKSLYREWRKLGRNVPRGVCVLRPQHCRKESGFPCEFHAQGTGWIVDVDGIANGEFNAAARSFWEQYGIPIAEP